MNKVAFTLDNFNAIETLEKISEEDVKCDMNPEFNCTICEHKKECMPKEDLER